MRSHAFLSTVCVAVSSLSVSLFIDCLCWSVAAIQVPPVLLELLAAAPKVEAWMTDKLLMMDLQHKAPAVKQLHAAEVQPAVQDFLAGSFNNPDALPDALVSIDNRDIHLHKLVVAKGCEVLARQWGPLWEGGRQTVALDTILDCPACSIKPSYSTALVFFEFFYSGKVTWREEAPDMASGMELLLMASYYDVPFLVCEAEAVLRQAVTVETCCKLLEVADHHSSCASSACTTL